MSPAIKRYRKKPVVIEGMQFDGTAKSAKDIIDWAMSHDSIIGYRCTNEHEVCKGEDSEHMLKIRTLEGDMYAKKGWWIIKGVKDEFYPCEPEIFDMTYEVVTDE